MRTLFSTIAFAFILALTPVVSGCGKKGPPMPPPAKAAPVELKDAEVPADVTPPVEEKAPKETTPEETMPEETPTEEIPGETPAGEDIAPEPSLEPLPEYNGGNGDNGAGDYEEAEDIFPPEMTPKELLLMDDTPEDWI